MKKCKVCETQFKTNVYKLYCSSKCAKYGASAVIYPDPKKRYKHQLHDVNGKKWHYTWYN